MKFIERVKLSEKRKLKKEAMGNRKSDDDALPNSPSTGGDPDAHDDQEADMDAEDEGPMEMSNPGKVVASKKTKLKKEDLSPSGGKTEEKEKNKDWIQKAVNPDNKGACTPMSKSSCTPRRKALAKTFKKMGKKRDAEVVSKKEKDQAK